MDSTGGKIFTYQRVAERSFLLSDPGVQNAPQFPTATYRDEIPKLSAEANAELNKAREQFTDKLARVFTAAYSPRSLPLGSKPLRRPWGVADKRPFLYVVIKEADFVAQPSLKVRALVHKVGDESVTLNNQVPYEFVAADFQKFHDARLGDVRWAAHNLEPEVPFSESLQKELERIAQTQQATIGPAK